MKYSSRLVPAVLLAFVMQWGSAASAAPVCRVSSATPLVFEPLESGGAPSDGRASFVITCARQQTEEISLIYSHRLSASKAGDDILYELYATPDRSAVWGSGGDGSPISLQFPAGQPTKVYIYARVLAHQRPAAGTFNDIVEVQTFP